MTDWQIILEAQLDPSPPVLSIEEAEKIYLEAPLSELLYVARERKKQVPGNIVTHMIDRNINYTNICTINCNFCSFYRSPGHDEGYTQTIDQISARIEELEELGGSRILMQGGVNPSLSFEWYTELISELSRRHPSIALDCFSPIGDRGNSGSFRTSDERGSIEASSIWNARTTQVEGLKCSSIELGVVFHLGRVPLTIGLE